MKKKITILGAGIAGLTTAISLRQKGFDPVVFESASEIKAIGAGLALAGNAMMGYERLGILKEIIDIGQIVSSLTIYDQKGKLIMKTELTSFIEKYNINNYVVHRAELQKVLLSHIDPDKLFLNKKTIDIEQFGENITIHFADGTAHETKSLIVAEGINSVIRKKLIPDSSPRYSGYTCWRGIINTPDSVLDIKTSNEIWGKGKRFGISHLTNKRIYWFACINATVNNETYKNYTIADIQREFHEFSEPVQSILSHTKNADLIWADIFDLKPNSNFAFDNILFIGDAAHATTPNMGQGACQAIEDAIIIGEELEKESNVSIAFKAFEKRRAKRVNGIVKKSWILGKIGQLDNKFLIKLRNFVFRVMPDSFKEKQVENIYKVDF